MQKIFQHTFDRKKREMANKVMKKILEVISLGGKEIKSHIEIPPHIH